MAWQQATTEVLDHKEVGTKRQRYSVFSIHLRTLVRNRPCGDLHVNLVPLGSRTSNADN